MSTTQELNFFHSPNTRSTGVLILLQELGAKYRLHLLDLLNGEQRKPSYLAINPMGKVPALKHGEAIITEQVAIYIYLADLYPNANLAPKIGDPLRGPYLRWMAIYGSCFEPAIIDHSQNRQPAPQGISPYGDFDTLLKTLTDQFAKGPYLLGDRFTAADVLWGTALNWVTAFQLLPEVPVISAYLNRLNARASVKWAREKEVEFSGMSV